MKRSALVLCTQLFRLLAKFAQSWKILGVIAYFFIFDTVPHVLIAEHLYKPCTYLGNKGLIYHPRINAQGCPLLILANPSQHRNLYE